MVDVVADMVRAVQNFHDEFHCRHVRGRPQIPISEDLLESSLGDRVSVGCLTSDD